MKIKKIPRFVIFCFVGGIATLIDFIVFNIFAYILGDGLFMPQISRALGIGISMIWNFSMNRNITFRAKDGKIINQLPKWLLVYGITSLINLGIFSIILSHTGNSLMGRNIAFVCGTGISIILNFLGSLLWTFKRKSYF